MEKSSFTKKDTNIIKGCAIIFLMIHHCFRTSARYAGYDINFAPLNQQMVTYLAAFLKICVPMFVFLTAYGMTISLKNRNHTLDINGRQMVDYIKHRLFHLYTAGCLYLSCVKYFVWHIQGCLWKCTEKVQKG